MKERIENLENNLVLKWIKVNKNEMKTGKDYLNEEIDDEEDSSSKNVYYLCKGCGAIYSVDDPRACKCNCENKSYIKIKRQDV